MKSKKFNSIIAETPQHIHDEVEFNMDILERLHELLEKKFEGKQKLLAERLGKSEAEVSKWFNGYQNFTVRTLVMLNRVFESPVVAVCSDQEINTNYELVKVSGQKCSTRLQVPSSGIITEFEVPYQPLKNKRKAISTHLESFA